ncbi:MAG: DUF3552 domain-containing protein, partial [Bacteroidetes bacterium]|nr:DUF3552 domain-containing protein [Bacteroidota bacterium]
MDIFNIVSGLVGLIVGGGVAYVFLSKQSSLKANATLSVAEEKAKSMLREAEEKAKSYKKSREIEAKERFLQLKQEHEKEVRAREKEISQAENDLRKKDQSLSDKMAHQDRKIQEMETVKKNLEKQLEIVNIKREEVEKTHVQQVKNLEKIAGLTAEEAKKDLVEALKEDARTDALAQVKNIVEEAKLTAHKDAKRMILQTIQRTAAEQAIENTVTVFNIENDEVKGRIIGREGRNIRALEAATGIEIIVDDTPEAIILSGFDPVRREIARMSLHRLITDGRIHPARIEEVVEKTRKDVEA